MKATTAAWHRTLPVHATQVATAGALLGTAARRVLSPRNAPPGAPQESAGLAYNLEGEKSKKRVQAMNGLLHQGAIRKTEGKKEWKEKDVAAASGLVAFRPEELRDAI